uniref:GIR1-like zinc ribbon domain-containing protein n=1 Tax=Leersia perrieri TaxID=77586 RepID=A0A0D9X3E2_9ORYZ
MEEAAAGMSSPHAESPASSCVSSEYVEEATVMTMVVAGCPQCLMYVMLAVPNSKEEMKQPRCPRCNSAVLLHFHNLTTN